MMLKSAILCMLLATGAVLAPTAEATTLANLSQEQLVDASTYVLKGTITEVWVEFDEDDMIWTRAKLAVDTTYKGPDTPSEIIIDTQGGRIGDQEVAVYSAARFSEGEKVVVFLASIKFGTRWTPVEMFRGKFTIRRAPGDVRPIAQNYLPRQSDVYDHRFIPAPDMEHRIYLEDLLNVVETRLQTGWDGQPIPGISPTELTRINSIDRRRIHR